MTSGESEPDAWGRRSGTPETLLSWPPSRLPTWLRNEGNGAVCEPTRGSPGLVSVVMPCLNVADSVRDQLDAMARQTYRGPWELVVADNGSGDRTRDIVAAYALPCAGLRLVDSSARRGVSYARNTGVEGALGDLIVFVDADDLVSVGWLDEIVRASRNADVVVGHTVNQRSARPRQAPHPDPRIPERYGAPFITSCNMAVWRDVHEAIGGFDEAFLRAQDVDYSLRAHLLGVWVRFAPRAVVWRRARPDARSTFRQFYDYGRYDIMLENRYGPLGMPRRTSVLAAKKWLYWTTRTPLAAVSRRHREDWARNVGKESGRTGARLRQLLETRGTDSRPSRPSSA
jgi:glycosyltransferase involved in cell wall biosynthesis